MTKFLDRSYGRPFAWAGAMISAAATWPAPFVQELKKVKTGNNPSFLGKAGTLAGGLFEAFVSTLPSFMAGAFGVIMSPILLMTVAAQALGITGALPIIGLGVAGLIAGPFAFVAGVYAAGLALSCTAGVAACTLVSALRAADHFQMKWRGKLPAAAPETAEEAPVPEDKFTCIMKELSTEEQKEFYDRLHEKFRPVAAVPADTTGKIEPPSFTVRKKP